jgi:DNA-binding GntR family transcriptional regulator
MPTSADGPPAGEAAPAGRDGWISAPVGRVAAPLRDQVLTALREAILDLRLPPGRRLIERELVGQLGVSRTTVREVLACLVSEGLVTVIPQRGAIVSVVSAKEAADIYEIRVALEVLAVRRFVERASPTQVRRLRAALERMAELTERDDRRDDVLHAKDALYELLLDGADSPPLAQVLTMLQGRVRVMRATSLSVEGRSRQAVAELRAVVEAIEAGDADAAARACTEHVRNAAASGIGRLAARDTSS